MFGFIIKAQTIQILSIIICSAQAFLISRPFRTFTYKHSMMIDAYTTSYVASSSQFQKSKAKNASIYFERVQIEGESLPVLNKPVLLFLPGLDGRGDYSSNNIFANFTEVFDCWRMVVQAHDRTPFLQVADAVSQQISSFPKSTVSVLMGESFGGLLALYVASTANSISNRKTIERLVLVNPATSYDRTTWPILGNLIARTGSAFPAVGIATLMATVVQPEQFISVGQVIAARINSTDAAIKEMNEMLSTGNKLVDLMPPETLRWRLNEWLLLGSFLMNDRLNKVSTPTLILAGGGDRLLPSGAEGRRLLRELSASSDGAAKAVDLVEFPERGHALLDGSFDLLSVIAASKVFQGIPLSTGSADRAALSAAKVIAQAGGKLTSGLGSGIGPISYPMDYRVDKPTQEDLIAADKQIELLVRLTSPIFLSKDKDNRIVRGLGPVPTGAEGRPVLLVGNHQLIGGDLAFIVRQFLREKNTLVRGLAHPAIFTDGAFASGEENRKENSMQSMFKKFGAVPVSSGSIYELMKINETILLFPGGAREALHGKNEKYQLFWPEKVDFVRMAGLMDAIIVPFAAIGVADSVEILVDPADVLKLPFVGSNARKTNSRIPQARVGQNDNFAFPVIAPSASGPARQYFLFQKPFDTRSLNIYNKIECKIAYAQMKGEVEAGIQQLLRLRREDPYKNFLPRFAYERLLRRGQQAPTAPLNLKSIYEPSKSL